MEMILDGNTSKEAAEKLSLSPRTVEFIVRICIQN
ncbi:LuxR C-terminal-related transcriptional regulator [Proteus mirabilis]